jgi:tetratricopeptide (TPR) repeat protein
MKKHDSVPYFIDRLKVIKTRIPGLESQILPLLFQFEISMSIARENYNEAIMIVEKYDDQLKKKHTEFTPNSKAKVHFYTAVAYFGGEQYKKALGYLNKIVDLGEKLLMPELFIACRLVRMMIHYEMNHHEYLDYDIRSFERKLQKNGIFYKMEKIMVGLFKKNSNTMDVKTIRANFMACNNALSKLENTPFEMQLSNLFNFNAWLQKKRLHLSK